MFICVPDSVKSLVKDVSPGHWRVQAVVISTTQSRTLLINSYFPFDKRIEGEANEELNETLAVIQNTISNNTCDSVVWSGDINADFTRNNIQPNSSGLCKQYKPHSGVAELCD